MHCRHDPPKGVAVQDWVQYSYGFSVGALLVSHTINATYVTL